MTEAGPISEAPSLGLPEIAVERLEQPGDDDINALCEAASSAIMRARPWPRAQGAMKLVVSCALWACASLFLVGRTSCADPTMTPSRRPTISVRSGTSSTPFQ